MTRTAHIAAARRTIVAPRGGALARFELHDLAAPVLTACLSDAALASGDVDEVILSNGMGGGGNPARLAALAAGLPERVAGLSMDRQCAGGLDALRLAQAMILSGQARVVLAGGVESYSRRPVRMRVRDDGPPVAYDRPPFSPWPARDPDMAQAAEALARRLGISRAAQDDWAMQSHARALAGRAAMAPEIVAPPFGVEPKDPFARRLSPRLCARAPVVAGSVTAANMAVAADAAAVVLVVSDEIAQSLPGRSVVIGAGATLGGALEEPGLAPVAAIRQTLQTAGLTPEHLAAAEIMEAFAVQAIACIHGAALPREIVNRKGGALARGHPIGASGAVLAVRLFHDLCETGGNGIAAIAAAGGIGTALVLSAPGSAPTARA